MQAIEIVTTWYSTTALLYIYILNIHGSLFILTEALSGGEFGEGTGMMWLSDVQCIGNESTLSNCVAAYNASDSCSHSQDAAVRCTAGNTCSRTSAESVFSILKSVFAMGISTAMCI